METYLQFGDNARPPMATIEVQHKVNELWWQKQGLQYTVTGYGRKIPSRYMVKHDGRWRRVYATCFSNVASHWIIVDGEKVTVTFYE